MIKNINHNHIYYFIYLLQSPTKHLFLATKANINKVKKSGINIYIHMNIDR